MEAQPSPDTSSRRRRWLEAGAIAVGLIALSVIATWPLATHMNRFVEENDPFIGAWNLWWIAQSLIHLENPWYSHDILAPEGSYLSFHALTPLYGLVMSPLTLTAGAGLTYNITKLLLGPLAAVAGYVLARTLGLDRGASWVAGGLWGFSTIAAWRIAYHQNFGAALCVLPLVVAAAARYERDGRARYAALAGAALGACALIDPTMALLAGMALAIWVLTGLRSRERRGLWLRGAPIAALVAFLVALPQLAMMLRAASSGGYEPNLEVQAGTWIGGATNLMTMLSPADVAPWFPGNLESLAYRHPWGEATPTYGWGALALAAAALALYAAHRIRARSGPGPSGRALLWGGLVLLTGTILALGPVLRLTETAHVPLAIEQYSQRLSALMPYTWLVQLPVLQDVRVPSRFVMLGMLGAAMLAGFGFSALWRRGVLGRTLALAAVAFAVVEAGFTDGGALQKWVPLEREKLYAPVRADKSSSVVVDVPLAWVGATYGMGRTPDRIEPELRATEHGHPIAEGYITRLAPKQIAKLAAHPFYKAVLAQQGAGPDDVGPLPPDDKDVLRADIASMGIGWVVQWPSASKRVPGFLRSLGFTPVRRSDGITLWRAPPPAA